MSHWFASVATAWRQSKMLPIESPSARAISRGFDVYGFRFRITGPASSSAGMLAGDFQFFDREEDVAGL